MDSARIFEKPTLAPVVRELPADLETPVSVYLKLAGRSPSFLLESVSGGEQLARYSFIGINPSQAYVLKGRTLEVHNLANGKPAIFRQDLHAYENPLEALKQALTGLEYVPAPGLPRFSGGLVGYLGYEMMRFFEPTVSLHPHPDVPDAIFLLADTLVAFDHAFGRLLLIGNVSHDDNPARQRVVVAEVEARLDDIERRLSDPLPAQSIPIGRYGLQPGQENSDKGSGHNGQARLDYMHSVETAKEYIAAGDIFQVVLSRRVDRETTAAPFDVYRNLRRLNPSPYMFYFDFDRLAGPEPFHLIGASPEMHVRLEGRSAAVRPIAGTRRRGATPLDDARMEAELLADPKERAEHVMLVDLGRNDLGRICEYGSIHVPEQMIVERYSHVIHLVSHVEGQLRPEHDAFDLLKATFPAGTVSGAPKIRAMQIIDELEAAPRGVYAGAVGYFGYDGSMDTCIAIRTIVMHGQTAHLQAGAGIVADSVPESEYQETENKLGALAVALDMAEKKESA